MWPFKKKSEIKNVTVYGNKASTFSLANYLHSYSSKEVNAYLNMVDDIVSPVTRFKVTKPDLLLYFHSISFTIDLGIQIAYFKDDEESKKLANDLYKKFKKIKVLGSLTEIDSSTPGYVAVKDLKDLKRKIFIRSNEQEEKELLKKVFLNFLEDN